MNRIFCLIWALNFFFFFFYDGYYKVNGLCVPNPSFMSVQFYPIRYFLSLICIPSIWLDSIVSPVFLLILNYIPALRSTSSPPVVWAASSSWTSAPESEIRVSLQSVPVPPLLMLQARKRAVGSPAATQIQPAKARTQAPGRQSATVCHFNPHAPTGLRRREGRGEAASERAREGWRPQRKTAPRGREIF